MQTNLHACSKSHILSRLLPAAELATPGAVEGVFVGACGPLTGSGACVPAAAAAPAGRENLDFLPDMGVRALQDSDCIAFCSGACGYS